MSAALVVAMVAAAVLLSWAIVAALRSYEAAADRVTEATRIRLYAAGPSGAHYSLREGGADRT